MTWVKRFLREKKIHEYFVYKWVDGNWTQIKVDLTEKKKFDNNKKKFDKTKFNRKK